jgi:hypothetical protein
MANLDDHLDKLLESSFSPKPIFLAFKKDMKSLLEMLLEMLEMTLGHANWREVGCTLCGRRTV